MVHVLNRLPCGAQFSAEALRFPVVDRVAAAVRFPRRRTGGGTLSGDSVEHASSAEIKVTSHSYSRIKMK